MNNIFENILFLLISNDKFELGLKIATLYKNTPEFKNYFGCSLEDLILQVNCHNFNYCNLDSKNIFELSNIITKVKELESLYLDFNNLSYLPSSIGELENLECLSLNNNKLITLPNGIGKLKKLYILSVCDNELEHLPSSICDLENLNRLYLSDNNLVTLPKEIGNLKKLEVIFIDNNPIKFLPITLKNSRCRIRINKNNITNEFRKYTQGWNNLLLTPF